MSLLFFFRSKHTRPQQIVVVSSVGGKATKKKKTNKAIPKVELRAEVFEEVDARIFAKEITARKRKATRKRTNEIMAILLMLEDDD